MVLFTKLAAFAALVPLITRLPLPRAAALLVKPPRRVAVSDAEVERLARLTELAPRVAWPLVRTGCLTRGVTLFWFLRRAGLNVELRFGLDATDPDRPDGHCWLSVGGEPYLEPRDPRPKFTELYRIPLRTA